jgi:hypothetical protein
MPGHTRKQKKQKKPVAKKPAVKKPVAKKVLSAKAQKRNRVVKKTPVKNMAQLKKIANKAAPKKTSAKKIPKGKIGLLTAGLGTVIGGVTAMRNKPKSFGEAFKKARKDKGPNSTFTYKGKKYSTVTKDQIKKAGFTNLRDYLNSKKKK